jgi:pSer/pThr/pTyr-binding forkhead associated (FHA) protein
MSELTVTLLRLGYLALLWVLVLSTVAVLRRDLYGTKISDRRKASRAAGAGGQTRGAAPATSAARGPAAPTRLVVTEGPLRGTILPLGASSVLIGRAPSCTLVLDDDFSSSRHARLFPQDGGWFVEDLGSTNGTFVGEAKVTAPVPVPTGTPVRVGRTVLELQR